MPDDQVFEFSVHLWGMIQTFSGQVYNLVFTSTGILNKLSVEPFFPTKVSDFDKDKVSGKSVSLHCPLSGLQFSEPVKLPGCPEFFDRLSVIERIRGILLFKTLQLQNSYFHFPTI